MENKINIAELLKDCPNGMELDCALFESLEFDSIEDNEFLPIRCRIKNSKGGYNVHNFTEYGQWNTLPYAKCVIFPKGKNTWEGFHKPFKDGDIVYLDFGHYYKITIFKRQYSNFLYYHASLRNNNVLSINISNSNSTICTSYLKEIRFATEEEKQKLFDAIKANGYHWNPETKTLEKLIEPKFTVGDTIKNKDDKWQAKRTIQTYVAGIGYFTTINDCVRIDDQDNWELVPIKPKFKVGDRIKLKGEELFWVIKSIKDEWYICTNNSKICISEQHHYELASRKFNVDLLIPFESKVLVRIGNSNIWEGDIFVRYDKNATVNKFHCIGGWYKKCIPFKGNEWLLGTTDDCNDYYKTWKD